jgi:hypothetical protein
MRQSWHYFGLDILLNISPWLAILRRSIWKKLLQVPRLDVRQNTALLYGIIVVDDYSR